MYEDDHLESDYEDNFYFDDSSDERDEEDVSDEDEETYVIVRFYQDVSIPSEVLKTGQTLAEVHEWCKDPETSSSTAKSDEAVERTRKCGQWFDGYEEE